MLFCPVDEARICIKHHPTTALLNVIRRFHILWIGCQRGLITRYHSPHRI